MNGWRKKIQCLPHIIMDAIILTVALFCTFSFECLRLLKCFYNIKVSQTKMVTVLLNEIVSFFLFIHQFRHRHSISFPILIPVPTPFPFWFLFVPFLSSSLQNYSMFWRFHCFVCVYLYITLMEITLFFGRSKFWYSWSYVSLYGNNVAFIVIWICNWCQRAHSRVLFPPRVPWEPRRYGVRVNDWGLKMKSLLL